MDVVTLHRGSTPLLISLPHDGTALPAAIADRLTDSARKVPDTDWFVSRLYRFAERMGASVLVPGCSRYVVDLNRPPDDVSLYPGQNSTGLCPTVQFSGEPVYRPGLQPSPAEVLARVDQYWRPYHDALASELARLRASHGRVLLWEGHSIRSRVPFLFDGQLPDINVGTAGGDSCLPATQLRIERRLQSQAQYTWVSNGRFKGGHITRHYGRPAEGVEAVQLELAQRGYMDEAEASYHAGRAAQLQSLLEQLLLAALG